MPTEQGYEQRTSPRAAAAMPLASPEQFGAGVARAAGQLGEQLHQQQLRGYQIERKATRDRELADWSHQFALHRQNLDDIVRTTRGNAPAGAAGHREGVLKAHEAARETLFARLTDPEVQRHAQAQWDTYQTGLADAEGTFEETQRVAKLVGDFGQSINIGANRIRLGMDDKAYASELGMKLQEIDLLSIDGAQKDRLRRQVEQGYGVAFIQHLQDTNPVMARGLLDSGAFGHLDGDVLEQLRSGADVEIRRQLAAAEETQRHEQAAARENIATLSQALTDGLEVDDAQIKAAIDQATAMGDTSTALRLQGLAADNAFAKVYRGQSPVQREQRVAALAGKKSLDVAEQRELKWLQDKRASLDSRFNEDVVAWAMENAPEGYKPPAGDITDAGVIQSRIAWARRASAAYGRTMPYFTKAEVDQLAARKGDGLAGEQDVLAVLDRFPEGPDRAAAALQLDPEDKVFQQMAQMKPHFRGVVRAGAQAIKANAKFMSPSATEAPEAFEAMEQIDARLRMALKEFQPEDQEAVLTLAKQWLAGTLTRRNMTGEDVNEGAYDTAVRVALGGVIRDGQPLGGLGSWNGAPFVLPPGYSNASFGAAVGARLKVEPALQPVNPDGTAIPIGELRPVMIAPNRYRFESRGGRVARRKDGQVLLLDLRGKP